MLSITTRIEGNISKETHSMSALEGLFDQSRCCLISVISRAVPT